MCTRHQRGKYFERAVALIISELDVALEWDAPIVIFAIYRSEHVVDDVELSLKEDLAVRGQNIIRLRISREYYNVDRIIAQKDKKHSVFSILGISQGGGEDQANAYKALNLHREFFIENNIRVIFWLTEDEIAQLPRHAPDFWAFRHRVLEFLQFRATPKRSALIKGYSWHEWPFHLSKDSSVSDFMKCKGEFGKVPDNDIKGWMQSEILANCATIYFIRSNLEMSRKYLEVALDLQLPAGESTLTSQLRIGLGIVLSEIGELAEAEKLLEHVVHLSPSSTAALCELGILHRKSGRRKDAIRYLTKSIRLSPNNPNAWNELGNVYNDLGHTQNALFAYKKAYHLSPDRYETSSNLGYLLLHLEQHNDALAVFQKLASLFPQDAQIWIENGRLLFQLGRHGEALAAFQTSQELQPENIYTIIAQVACYRQMNLNRDADQLSQSIAPIIGSQIEYIQALFESVTLNTENAIALLGLAIKKQQVVIRQIKFEPCLSFLHDVPAFGKVFAGC